MKPHPHLAYALAAATLIAAPPAALAAPPDDAQAVAATAFANGGVGASDQQRMHRIAQAYPLRITFSRGQDGAYLARVPVVIRKADGGTVFELANAGPLLYLRLPPGSYSVEATAQGLTEHQNVTLRTGHPENLYFHWNGHPA